MVHPTGKNKASTRKGNGRALVHRCRVLTLAKLFGTVLVVLIGTYLWSASDSDWELEPMKPNLKDKASLQRGLGLYVNFCLGCHSLQYRRYERTAKDLGDIHKDDMLDYVIFTGQPIGDYMYSSMSKEDAKSWFGAAPPDLTMVTRVRSPKWVYNFLKTFYMDDSRPFGVNNKVFPNVGMPHALLPLQGVPEEICYGYEAVDLLAREPILREKKLEGILTRTDRDTKIEELDPLEGRELNCPEVVAIPGTGLYTPEQFDQAAYDIANFLHYMGDPSREVRMSMGRYVIAFLVILMIFAYILKREFWKDVPKSPRRVREEHTTEL